MIQVILQYQAQELKIFVRKRKKKKKKIQTNYTIKFQLTNLYVCIFLRADYWKSQGRKFCDFCRCWIADNKPSIEFHEGGKKHKENVSKRLKEIHKNSAKQAKITKKFEHDIRTMENVSNPLKYFFCIFMIIIIILF